MGVLYQLETLFSTYNLYLVGETPCIFTYFHLFSDDTFEKTGEIRHLHLEHNVIYEVSSLFTFSSIKLKKGKERNQNAHDTSSYPCLRGKFIVQQKLIDKNIFLN